MEKKYDSKKVHQALALLTVSIFIIGAFTGWLFFGFEPSISDRYDFRYYGRDFYYSDDMNMSVRFYSHDKADDTLTFLFFKDGNYTISLFYDVEGDFTTRYLIEENVTVSGLVDAYPYIDRAYEYVIKRTDLFNPRILIDVNYRSEFIEFQTNLFGVETITS